MLIAAVLLLTPGCVKQPDWIESTLVTADVTGFWEGTHFGAAGPGSTLPVGRAVLALKQEGPKVRGKLGAGGRNSGPLEGRVGGDVFYFKVVNSFAETLTGEVTVSGDEMEVRSPFLASRADRQ